MPVSLGHISVLIRELLLLLLRVWQTTKIHWVRHFALAEAGQGFWNCPCVPMRERKECHCMLFLTPENDFAGKEQIITMEEIRESTANM
ncbi:ferredoxin-thioredoxin reductase catalytic chain, chloroplastic isoform X3 [Argentina anserina]|uniref:ferredoxin-thioredoxin reductase catalytic chain, chloroplastic isoform X3 n=1 Tax=Argentina anserina TaxID=57926 RepID=UPI0021763342|nr:ferredoxin-thioredoxin reductase catalytic chain, chloroplastic isoform X3 [Potentilla anserina]